MDPTSARSTTAVDAVLQGFLHDLGATHRRVAPGEWGLTIECAGWPLDVGLAVRGGLLRLQAEVVGPGRLDPAALLHRNRLGDLVRFAHSRAGAVWVHAELLPSAVDGDALDRVLGRLVEEAAWARYASASSSAP